MNKDQYFILKKSDSDYIGPDCTQVSSKEQAATFFYNKTDDTITMQDNQFGAFQQQRVCENNGKNCSNHGRCLHNTCKCNTGWSGNACEKALCPNGCSGHGKCDQKTGKCTCNEGWSGNACEKALCPNGCYGHGKCDQTTGKCTCNEGWSGNACEKALCPNGCSGHGKCDPVSGKCSCTDGWSGKDCSVSPGTIEEGLSIGAIIAIILGGLLLMGLVYYFLIHRQKNKGPEYIDPTPDSSMPTPDSSMPNDSSSVKMSPDMMKLSPVINVPGRSDDLTSAFTSVIDSPPSSDLSSDR